MIKSLVGLTCEVRLYKLNLITCILETRRLRDDLIETFKILKRFEGY